MANLRGGYEAPPSETSQESEERLQREEKARLIQRNLEKESVKKVWIVLSLNIAYFGTCTYLL